MKIAFLVLFVIAVAFAIFCFVNNQADQGFRILGGAGLLVLFFIYYLVKNR